MTPEIKRRIDQIRRGEVPEGYKKTKAGILPAEWGLRMLGECLQRIEKPVDVKPDEMYTQIGIRSHGKGLFYKEPVTGADLDTLITLHQRKLDEMKKMKNALMQLLLTGIVRIHK